MPPAFPADEYRSRQRRAFDAMERAQLDALIVSSPANICWLTGYDAWSFYTPQVLALTPKGEVHWLGRAMDAGAAGFTTYLSEAQVHGWPEPLIHRFDGAHPGDWIGARLRSLGLDAGRVGYEADSYALSPRLWQTLCAALPNARFHDSRELVAWCRLVKSEAELAIMQRAATLAEHAMETAFAGLDVGRAQSALMAEVAAAQISGSDTVPFGGDIPAIPPTLLAGEMASTAHPVWTDAAITSPQTLAFELGGSHRRYCVGLARTAHIGPLPDRLVRVAEAVEEGLNAVLAALKAGITGGEVHTAWQNVLDKHGLTKDSRIGYAIGLAFAPDWGEHTISLRAGEAHPIPTGATLHIMLGMWFADWGMELSETVVVTETGCRCLTQFPRDIFRP